MRGPVGFHLGAAALAVTVAAVLTDRAPEVEEVLVWQDRSIQESSGLVDTGEHLLTVNDSGGDPVVYVVDRESGETVGRTTYTTDEVDDVEALSPGPDGSLWVGDIGDNTASRELVSLYRLPAPAEGDHTVEAARYDLRYRGGPRDAEALLVHPLTGRVHVISKGILGGRVYRAPARLRPDRPNELTPVASAPAWVTDGAFLPGGRHAVVRTYGAVTLHEVPRWRAAAEMRLPDQRQGEGIAVSRPATTVLVSTEGRRTRVLSVPMSEELRAELTAPGEPRGATAEPTDGGMDDAGGADAGGNDRAATADTVGDTVGGTIGGTVSRWPLVAGVVAVAVLTVGGTLVALLLRRRRRR